jgi:solute carrier family 25 (mitochondrial oxoglutarate transporter), member 11
MCLPHGSKHLPPELIQLFCPNPHSFKKPVHRCTCTAFLVPRTFMVMHHQYWHAFLAGGLGDAFACLVSHPFDVTKVRLQLKGELSSIRQQSGMVHIFRTLSTIYKNEGIYNGLYCGLSAAISRQLVFSSLRHGTFGAIQTKWANLYNQPMALPLQVLCGAIIGATCAAIANPFDVVLIRMQADGHWNAGHRRGYKHVIDGLITIVKDEGILALWRGCSATVTRGVLITCSQLPAYHSSKYYLLQSGYFQNNTTLHISSSLISACVASLVTCPADVIKTRLMNMKVSSNLSSSPSSPPIVYSGAVDCIVRTAQTEGIRGFYKGVGATLSRLMPHTVLLWITQERILTYLRE